MVKVEFKSDYKLLNPDNENEPVQVKAGTHDAELIPNPLGYGGYWLVLKGTRIGASLNSLTQWTGAAWAEHEVIVTGRHGEKILNPIDGEYTLEILGERIANGEVTSPEVIAKYRRLTA